MNRLIPKARILSPVISVILIICMTAGCAFTYADTPESEITYVSSEKSEKQASQEMRTITGVTEEMCHASYWSDKAGQYADKLIMNHDEIAEYNNSAMNTPSTHMNDLANENVFPNAPYDAHKKIAPLSEENPFKEEKEIWVEGVQYINGGEAYFKKFSKAFLASAYQSTEQDPEWAVAVKRTGLLNLPTINPIGYDSNDYDDENYLAAVDINEPVVIRQKCEFEGHTFYYVYTNNLYGWIDADAIAICKDRDEWLEAWQVNIDSDDFLVVTQDKIILETSRVTDYSSKLILMIGTRLKLVPDEDIPEKIGERAVLYNHVVYIPTRDENGKYVRKMALISQHCSVSKGFLDYTQKNALEVSFSCLGNRYGWSGCDDAMDGSLYVRQMHKCFGFEMPRNTTFQKEVPQTIDISSMTSEEKQKIISTSPAGTPLMFKGNIVIYTGTEDNTGYAISSTQSICNPDSTDVISPFSVILNPLTAKRTSGHTWLEDMMYIINLKGAVDIGECDINVTEASSPEISVSYMGRTLYEGINYTVDLSSGNAVLCGINNFDGEKVIEKKARKISITTKKLKVNYSKVKKAAVKTSPVKVKNAAGKLTFTKLSGSKNIKIDKNTGKLTVKKGTAKGTYTVKIKANAEATPFYTKASASAVIKVCVK